MCGAEQGKNPSFPRDAEVYLLLLGIIPSFQVRLATMRKYGMSCMIFIQAVGQIKNLYKDDWETLMGACDTLVYLGGNELSSMEDLSKKLGDQSIRVRDSSKSHSAKGGSDSKSFKYSKRSLLTVDEIRRLKDGYCITVIKGQDPFYDKKYRTSDHANAKYLGDLGLGVRLFNFDYCNTKPQIKKLEETRRRIQDNKSIRSAVSKRPVDQVYKANTAVPPAQPMTEKEETELAKQIAVQTSIMAFDRDEAIKSGAVVTEVRDGIATVCQAGPPGEVASASGDIGKAVVLPKMTIKQEEVLNEYETYF